MGIVIEDEVEENEQLAKALTKVNESNPISHEDVARARQEHGSLFMRQLVAEQVSTRFGIVSLTINPFHPLMWSHYTTDGSGFVIGYDIAKLRQLAGSEGWLRKVAYQDRPARIFDHIHLSSPKSNLAAFLSLKSSHWCYEYEWRLIVELSRTIGTGKTDERGLPINLLQVPNEAVVSVYYTERSPQETVKLIRQRLADKNNRYCAENPRKLILSLTSYGYEVSPNEY